MNKSLLIASSLAALAPTLLAQDSTPKHASLAIQNQQYQQAIKLLDGYISGAKKLNDPAFTLDQLHFMKANAYLHLKDYKNAKTSAEALLGKFKNSKWQHKAIFLIAKTHVHQRQYKEALAIYEKESKRLFATDRKKEVAAELMKFADLMATPPKDPLSLEKPQYSKAFQLYKEVLDIECGTALHEQAQLNMIEMQRKIGNHNQVESLTLTYLSEFDPHWRGVIGSVQRVTFKKNLQAKVSGNHIASVRYFHAEALHRLTRRREADAYLMDLFREHKAGNIKAAQALIADAHWLRLHTLRQKGGRANDITEWTRATNNYLKQFPNHIHANKTSYLLGSMLDLHGKDIEAITAYQKYIKGDFNTTVAKDPLTLDKETEKGFQARQKLADRNREKVMHALGAIHDSKQDFEKARTAWTNTLQAYPNGALWASIQKELAELDYKELIHTINTVPKNSEPLAIAKSAVEMIDKFAAKHPLDQRLINLYFLRGKLPHTLATRLLEKSPDKKDLAKTLFDWAITNWQPLHSKYARSTESQSAYLLTAESQKNQLNDIEKSIESYKKANSVQARNALAQLHKKTLTVSATKVFTRNEEAHINLDTLNIKKVKVHQYWIDIESYFLKSKDLRSATLLDVDLVEPDATWEVDIKDFKKYTTHKNKIKVPFPNGKPGICVIKVESEDFVTTTVVQKSDIDLALRSSRNELIAFAKNSSTNKPAATIRLVIAEGEKIIATGTTDARGLFHKKLKKLGDISNYRVLAISEAGAAICNQSQNQQLSATELKNKAWFHQAQTNVRRGDMVTLNAVIREAKDHSFIYPKQRSYTFIARAGNTILKKEKVTLSAEGQLTQTFKIPSRTRADQVLCQLVADTPEKETFNHTVYFTNSAEFKGSVKVTLDKDILNLGDTITGKVTAAYRWGAPIGHRKLRLILPSGKHTDLITDAKGIATFRYDTTGIASGTPLYFQASVPSVQLSSHGDNALIDPLNLLINAEADKSNMAAGESIKVTVKTTDVKRRKSGAKLTLKVIQREMVEKFNLTSDTSRHQQVEKVVREIEMATTKELGKITQAIKLDKPGVYTLRIEGKDADGKPSFTETTVNVIGETSEQKLSLYHHNGKIFDDDKATLQIYSNLKTKAKALMTIETDHIVKYSLVDVTPGHSTLSVPLDPSYGPRFRCSLVTIDERKFVSCSDLVAISKKLNITTKIIGLTDGNAKAGSTLKAQVEVRDSKGNLSPALLYATLNPTEGDNSNTPNLYTPFTGDGQIIDFKMSTSCGFEHSGTQTPILAALKDEENRDPLAPNPVGRIIAMNNVQRVEKLLSLGQRAYNLGDTSVAIEHFANARRIAPNNKQTMKWLEKIGNDQRFLARDQYAMQSRSGNGNAVFLRGGNMGNGSQRKAANFGYLPNSNPIQGIPSAGNVFNTPSSGLRSGDTAITRDSINFFLNNPTRTSQISNAVYFAAGNNDFDNYSNRANGFVAPSSFATLNGQNYESSLIVPDLLPEQGQQSGSFTTVSSLSSTLPKWASKPILINGKQTIDIPLPKQSGKWKLSIDAVGKQGRVGQYLQTLNTTADYSVMLNQQHDLVEGDTWKPEITIFRKSTKEEVTVEFEVNFSLNGQAKKSTHSVKFAKGIAQANITLTITSLDKAGTIQLDVIQKQAGINEKYTLPIKPWGATQSRGFTHEVSAGTPLTFKAPQKKGSSAQHLNLMIIPQFDQQIIKLATGSLDHARPVPYIFSEPHPAGQLLAITAALDYLTDQKASNSPRYKSLHQQASWTFNELLSSMNNNGSWSLVKGRDHSQLTITAVAYEAIKNWEKLNKISDSNCPSTKAWLQGQFTSAPANLSESRCLIQMALAAGGKADFSQCNRLFRERARLSDAGKIFLAEAFIRLDRVGFAETLMKELTAKDSSNWTGKDDFFCSRNQILLGRSLHVMSQLKGFEKHQRKIRTSLLNTVSSQGFTDDISRGFCVEGIAASQPLFNGNQIIQAKGTGTVYVNGAKAFNFDISKPETLQIGGLTSLQKPTLLKASDNTIKIDFKGQGKVFLTGNLESFSKGFTHHKVDPNAKERIGITTRYYYHQGLSYKGTPLNAPGRTQATEVEQDQIITVYFQAVNTIRNNKEAILSEQVPAGFNYVKGSLTGGHSGARLEDDRLLITLKDNISPRWFSYKLIATTEGKWRHIPTSIRTLRHPENEKFGVAGKLTVTARGVKTSDVYKMTYSEQMELAAKHFVDQELDEVEKLLNKLRKYDNARENAQFAHMTLWVETAKAKPNARYVVDAFETLDAKMPELSIPFDKILKVGKAYAAIGEFERGQYVFAATIDGGYDQDSYVSVALEDQGRLLDAIDYQQQLWYHYPNSDGVNTAWFAMAQNLYDQAAEAANLTPRSSAPKKKLKATDIYQESIAMLHGFLSINPEHSSADEASYTIANGLFALNQYKDVVEHAKYCTKRYPKSKLTNSFRYMEALGSFWQRKYKEAIDAASEVAKGASEDKNLASFITAQIYHAKGQPIEAMKWYERIKDTYPDAKESIQFFEKKKIGFAEVEIVKSNNKAQLKLNYRNIDSAQLKIYRVDLMKLYLKQKNLSNITKVNLAGIKPAHELDVKLGDSSITEDQTKTIDLPISKDGAYLIICRGDYLYTSGLILITPLQMEVQEFPGQARLRVNIKDQTSGKLLDKVHVKAIGSNNNQFQKGETDLRGVWTTANLAGVPTVIAKDPKGRYAFFRGKQTYQEEIPDNIGGGRGELKPKSIDYNRNLKFKQNALKEKSWGAYDEKRRSSGKNKGIKVNKALKK